MKEIGTRVFWSKKKFSFFCEERDKRERKNINFHPKKEKIQKKRKKKLIFLLFFCSRTHRDRNTYELDHIAQRVII